MVQAGLPVLPGQALVLSFPPGFRILGDWPQVAAAIDVKNANAFGVSAFETPKPSVSAF